MTGNTDNGIYALLILTGIISAKPYTREDQYNDNKKIIKYKNRNG